jgi:hypothetical protein
MLSKLTWQAVTLLCVAMVTGACVLVGVPLWLVMRGSAPPALLVTPLTIVLGAIGTAATTYASYMKGKFELPPYLQDPTIHRAVRTVPPPPGSEELPIHVELPREP